MVLASSRADDFFDAKSVHQQSVGNQRTVAAPRHGFGAHQRDLLVLCQFHQGCEVLREFRRLHVVGVTAE